ncbi:hypothetical protein ABI59_01010 [Acidobacteria bacterium Mor1]|nr:hypothetical protein ABI59_01010 [Acidobacteria bacterium Mor1]
MESTDLRAALRLLNGLESGAISTYDAGPIAADLDPVLCWAIIHFLRETYPASDPAASGVLGRVVELTGKNPDLVKKVGQGQADPISEWFRSEYAFRDFRGRGEELLELLVEKLEG